MLCGAPSYVEGGRQAPMGRELKRFVLHITRRSPDALEPVDERVRGKRLWVPRIRSSRNLKSNRDRARRAIATAFRQYRQVLHLDISPHSVYAVRPFNGRSPLVRQDTRSRAPQHARRRPFMIRTSSSVRTASKLPGGVAVARVWSRLRRTWPVAVRCLGLLAVALLLLRTAAHAAEDVRTVLLGAVADGTVTVDELVQAVGAGPRSGARAAAGTSDPSIDVGSATGAPGEQVSFDVTLNAGSAVVAAAQNDLAFDSINTPIAATPSGAPDCAVNPSINKESTAFVFRPIGCSGTSCTMIRAIVISFFNADPIPDGSVLYTCKVDISPSAMAATYPLAISNVFMSTPDGQLVPGATGTDGEIVVTGGGPTSKAQCKNGGWRSFSVPRFKNQGDCIQFVNTGR